MYSEVNLKPTDVLTKPPAPLTRGLLNYDFDKQFILSPLYFSP